MRSPDSFRADPGIELAAEDGAVHLDLRPYAVARIDTEAADLAWGTTHEAPALRHLRHRLLGAVPARRLARAGGRRVRRAVRPRRGRRPRRWPESSACRRSTTTRRRCSTASRSTSSTSSPTSIPTARFVRLAADRRLPVICQKPLAPTLEEAERMVAACREAGVPLLVHENWRWQAPIRAAQARPRRRPDRPAVPGPDRLHSAASPSSPTSRSCASWSSSS